MCVLSKPAAAVKRLL